MKILELDEIKALLPGIDLISAIEDGFVAYSTGRAVVPPVGELLLAGGECHIKYGFIRSQPNYVVKIASGFPGNAARGLSTSNGCMLLFCQETGRLSCILLDEGHLTDVRTAVAGAIAAKQLAPKTVARIGIVGTGIQARAQLRQLESVTDCRNALVWGRSRARLDDYVEDLAGKQATPAFRIETTLDIAEIQESCNLIVTTTPATRPLLQADAVKPGTHITAVGSDTPQKQELDSEILRRADLLVADSIAQCRLRGEISHALRDQVVESDRIVELGNVIAGTAPRRTDDGQITIADLTGVAVQDLQIASAVFGKSLEPA